MERDVERESGVEGCSGADAVAFRALGSSNLESCEVAGECAPHHGCPAVFLPILVSLRLELHKCEATLLMQLGIVLHGQCMHSGLQGLEWMHAEHGLAHLNMKPWHLCSLVLYCMISACMVGYKGLSGCTPSMVLCT